MDKSRRTSSSTNVDHPPGLTTGAPDLAILIVAASRVIVDRLVGAMRDGGLGEVRPAHGFVIRAVHAERPTVSRLAALLDTSKQAASKLVDGMVRAGLLERFVDPDDRRLSRLRLADRGAKVRRRALATSASIEKALRRSLGEADVSALRRALLQLLEDHGALDEVQAGRARPVW